MYKVIDVCEYILEYCQTREIGISNLKLQKILYFIQAEFLVAKDTPCFKEEIVAWGFGPAVPAAYYEYRVFGSTLIPNYIHKEKKNILTVEDKEIINEILERTINISDSYLCEITMSQDPWRNVYCNGLEVPISNASIKSYFS